MERIADLNDVPVIEYEDYKEYYPVIDRAVVYRAEITNGVVDGSLFFPNSSRRTSIF